MEEKSKKTSTLQNLAMGATMLASSLGLVGGTETAQAQNMYRSPAFAAAQKEEMTSEIDVIVKKLKSDVGSFNSSESVDDMAVTQIRLEGLKRELSKGEPLNIKFAADKFAECIGDRYDYRHDEIKALGGLYQAGMQTAAERNDATKKNVRKEAIRRVGWLVLKMESENTEGNDFRRSSLIKRAADLRTLAEDFSEHGINSEVLETAVETLKKDYRDKVMQQYIDIYLKARGHEGVLEFQQSLNKEKDSGIER